MLKHLTRNILIYNKSLLLEQLLKQHVPPHYLMHTLGKATALTEALQTDRYDALLLNIAKAEPDITVIAEIVARYSGKLPLMLLCFDTESTVFLPNPTLRIFLKPLPLHNVVTTLKTLLFPQENHDMRLNNNCTLSPASRSLMLGNIPITLTEKEVALLRFLHEGEGKIINKAALLQHIWGYGEHTDTHTVETHIYRLRQKIGEGLIITEDNGYRLAR